MKRSEHDPTDEKPTSRGGLGLIFFFYKVFQCKNSINMGDILSDMAHSDNQLKMTTADILAQLSSLPIESLEKEQIGQQILAWTEGNLVLTPHVIELIKKDESVFQDESVKDAVNHIIQEYFSPALLNSTIEPNNRDTLQLLKQIQQSLLVERPMRDRLLQSYQEILLFRHHVPSGYTPEQKQLLTLGIVAQDNKQGLKVANPIYRRVFNRQWIGQYLQHPFAVQKEYWLLLTALLSIVAFALLQSTFRYLPMAETRNCIQEEDLKNAITANFSLDSQQMEQAIERLRRLKKTNELTGPCQEILHDLDYNYAIYFEAGTYNQPFNAAKRLCGIPESYYKGKKIRPWFYRWGHIYGKTDFDTVLSRYIQKEPCPAYGWLSSPNIP